MRLHRTVAAALGAFALIVAVPNSAHAAEGTFGYKDELGLPVVLHDPASRECINLPGTSELLPGSAPENLTDATATVFLDRDCAGDTYYVMDPGKVLGGRLKLRSVIFS
ncbi:hypothetical protein [Kitasatospora sp. LaBMicrA B282]|uniref:hypothetical protein n=1 Tax=Kitasatospora sp. LaBMicrA B282 TaxID=3420949 RepID=UPI003D133646